jgi:tricorn protease-like protein
MRSRLARSLFAIASLATCAAAPAVAAGPAKLLRFPDVFGDQVAFCYAGDIWKAPI